MLVKVCGISDPEFIRQIDEVHIHFMGFIFYPASKRFVGDKLSAEQINSIPEQIKRVGVFVNENIDQIIKTVKTCKLDFAQLHGHENVSFVKEISQEIKVIKVFRIDETFEFLSLNEFEDASSYFLFDTKDRLYGGTGKKFNWNILQKYTGNIPFLLSGGISPGDAEKINEIHHPMFMGIDINSGFETKPGKKDIQQIQLFLNQLT